ncbi:MAG TPA: hypothetical protein VLM85_17325 [Polyangiaceae bacterium]|nr:hypothetical protein [Polyangiaceae bacterium]
MVKRHFEVLFYAWLWLNASALAWIVGRPWLAGVGLITVLPFLFAYARADRRASASPPPGRGMR